MPQIVFKILSTADQRESIVDDVRHLLDLNAEVLTADLDVSTGTAADSSLEEVWRDYGFADDAENTGQAPGACDHHGRRDQA
jgi:hypothetical protein